MRALTLLLILSIVAFGQVAEARHRHWPTPTPSPTATPASDPTPTPAPTPPPVVNLKDEGATGDGITDDQQAIAAAIAKAKSFGEPLYAPAGTYLHSGVITLNGATLFGDGDSTVFSASNSDLGAFILTGMNPSLKSIKTIRDPVPTVRTSAGATTGVYITGATDFVVDNITILGPSGAGMLTANSHGTADTYASIANCRVTGSLADAFHITNGSYYITESGNTATNPGDDMFPVVSYLGNPTPCHDILISGNTGIWNKPASVPNDSGRGLVVVGGNNITFTNNSVTNTNAAGIYIVSEASYNTYGVNNVTLTGNTVRDACLTSNTGHAGVLIFGRSGYPVSNVLLDGNTITNSGNQGIESRAFVSGITIKNCTVTTTGLGASGSVKPGIRNNGSRDMEISNCTISNTGAHGVKVENTSTGYCKILTNDFSKINYNTATAADVINAAPGSTLGSLIITSNTYHLDPPGWSVRSFINLNGFVGATVSGNQTVTP